MYKKDMSRVLGYKSYVQCTTLKNVFVAMLGKAINSGWYYIKLEDGTGNGPDLIASDTPSII
jgi:hypothetical protein